MPEWSNGAVSKTVNPFRGSRVRIPVFPQQEERCPDVASFFLFRIGPANFEASVRHRPSGRFRSIAEKESLSFRNITKSPQAKLRAFWCNLWVKVY